MAFFLDKIIFDNVAFLFNSWKSLGCCSLQQSTAVTPTGDPELGTQRDKIYSQFIDSKIKKNTAFL